MRISRKLILLNCIVLATLLTQVGIVLWFVGKATTAAEAVTGNVVPTLATIPEITKSFQSARIKLLLFASVPSSQEKQIAADFLVARQAFLKNLSNYEQAIDLDPPQIRDEDRRLAEALKAAVADWVPASDQLLTVEGTEQQVDFFLNQTSPRAGKVTAAIDALVAFNVNEGNVEAARTSAAITSLHVAIWVAAAIGCVIIIAFGFVISRGITRPLGRMQEQTREIAASLDFRKRFDVTGKDEIGSTAEALNALMDVTHGSLQSVSQVAANVGTQASDLAVSATELSSANTMVSNSSASMAAAVEQVAVSISHVADRSQTARVLANEAGELAAAGSAAVNEAIDKVNRVAGHAEQTARQVTALSVKATEIGTVVVTIKEIAEQINLLALNAAIEAARAGDQGRGFAVVADEVRKLAERTALSTRDISQTIEQIQEEANQTVSAIQDTVEEVHVGVQQVSSVGAMVDQLRGSSGMVLNSVSEISDAMSEQNIASTSLAQEIEKVAQMTEETSANALGTSEIGGRLDGYSRDLLEIVGRFKV